MIQILKKSFALLTRRERWLWTAFVPVSLTVAILEAFGAAIVFGLISVISDPSRTGQVPIISSLLTDLPGDENDAILILTAAAAVFFITKNVVLAAGLYIQNRVVNGSVSSMSRRLLKGYLTAPYSFHFQRNSADLIYNSTGAVRVVLGSVSAAVTLISEVLVVAAIMIVLLIAAPVVTIVAGVVLAGLAGLILRITQRLFAKWGTEVQVLSKEILQAVQQGLGGLKELKVLGRERQAYEAFSTRQQAFYRINYRRDTLKVLPRYLLESVFVSGLLLVVFMIAIQGDGTENILPLIGLYAYAGFRIIPSISRILLKLNQIRYGQTPVNRIYDDYMLVSQNKDWGFRETDIDLTFAGQVALEGISYKYSSSDAPSLFDIELSIARGESIGIVGSTGAGKSTLVDVFMGLLTPTAGRMTLDGKLIDDAALSSWQRKIGYVAQSIFLADDSLRRNVALSMPDEEVDDEQIWGALRIAQMDDFVRSLPEGLETFVGERGVRISGGERQRIGIARALYHEPEVLVFDEATSSLDNQTEASVMHAIQALRGDRTLLIIAHRLSTVRWCDRLIYMKNGRIVESGTFDELYLQNTDFREMADAAELDTPVDQAIDTTDQTIV
jgi:ATP-binding cassette subfamily C protein